MNSLFCFISCLGMSLVIKDAFRQILWRFISAIGWFLVIKMITPYLWPIRFGDYATVLKFFAIWSALADFGVYVIALKELWSYKLFEHWKLIISSTLQSYYNKFVSFRIGMICIVYIVALILAYIIPAYSSNIYLVRGLPIGMLFSASFMAAWIFQIPLQLWRKMKQVSIWLILARLVQLGFLAFIIFYWFPVSQDITLSPFLLVLWSVLCSWITQLIYVWRSSRSVMKFTWDFDRWFSKNLIFSNRKYWVAYYCSSFHTLAVWILLSILYPTIEWFIFMWIWSLALSLLEIMLIVPSALWNSLIHKTDHTNIQLSLSSFSSLLQLVVRIWIIIIVNFYMFSDVIIWFISWSKYLASTVWWVWSDTLLPFLGIVLLLSFVKQVYNYVFVSQWMQNMLLPINLTWVIIGLIVGIPMVYYFQLWWWIITQLLFELTFVCWAIFVAYRKWLLLQRWSVMPKLTIGIFLLSLLFTLVIGWFVSNIWIFIILTNISFFALSYYPIKQVVKSL